MARVAIVDYGTGNIHSVGRMLSSLGVRWVHTRDEAELREASHLLLPGVGHCAQAMRSLSSTGTTTLLNALVLEGRIPVLGICLGMQLMTLRSEEGGTECLGWFNAETTRIRPLDTRVFKVPNIGWHAINAVPDDPAFVGIALAEQPFYFCHAYSVRAENVIGVSATFEYGTSHVAALQRENILGVQFHPEKSQEAGMTLMRNFLEMDRLDV